MSVRATIVHKTEPPHTSTTQASGGVNVSTRNQALGAWSPTDFAL